MLLSVISDVNIFVKVVVNGIFVVVVDAVVVGMSFNRIVRIIHQTIYEF